MEYNVERDGPYGSHGPFPFDAPADGEDAAGADEGAGRTDIDDIAEALAPLVEKNNGLGELLAELRADPNNPATVIQLAQNLAATAPDVPQAAWQLLGPILSRLVGVIGPLARLFRRPPPNEQPRQLPAPKQRGEEPGAPPTGGPSPISPPRAKPPTDED